MDDQSIPEPENPESDTYPTLEDIHALKLDITGGMDAADYVDWLRDDGADEDD